MNQILLIDDDPLLCRGLAYSLERQGYRVITAPDADQGLAQARRDRPDLVLLDIGLPGMDGLDALPIFQSELRVPVILLTARRGVEDEALGLDLGADDYVAKPFDLERLLARIRAVLRRRYGAEKQPPAVPLSVGPLTLLPGPRVAQVAGQALDLAPREFDLLYALASAVGQVVPAAVLLDRVWGRGFMGEPQAVYVTVSKLREKLRAAPGHTLRIVTMHRVGYKLIDEET